MLGQHEVADGADPQDVALGAGVAVDAGIGEHDPAVVGDQNGARVDVSVGHAAGVQGCHRPGHRVQHRCGALGVEWADFLHEVAQGRTFYPLADHKSAAAFVYGVIDADEIGMPDPARGDGRIQHLLGGLAAWVSHDDRHRPVQQLINTAPDMSPGAVVVDVPLQAVALGQQVSSHPRRGRGRTITDLGHPSSLGAQSLFWARQSISCALTLPAQGEIARTHLGPLRLPNIRVKATKGSADGGHRGDPSRIHVRYTRA